jgi:hypothetical protein
MRDRVFGSQQRQHFSPRVYFNAKAARHVVRNSSTKGGETGAERIAMIGRVIQSKLRPLDDRSRRGDVGITDAQVDYDLASSRCFPSLLLNLGEDISR